MSEFKIVGGKLRKLLVIRPSDTEIIEQANRAKANGIDIEGQGPYRFATGVLVPVVVGPHGCSCAIWRNGVWCQHRSLYAVASGEVVPPRPQPISLKIERSKRGWTHRTNLQPVASGRPMLQFRMKSRR